MKTLFSENLSNGEVSRRFVLTAAILAFFFASPGMPAWVALVSVYPFATALLKWDPLNAMLENISVTRGTEKVATTKLQRAM